MFEGVVKGDEAGVTICSWLGKDDDGVDCCCPERGVGGMLAKTDAQRTAVCKGCFNKTVTVEVDKQVSDIVWIKKREGGKK